MLKAFVAALLLSPACAFASAIDLHLHLPMIQKQVALKDLEAADMRLIVAVAYAPPVLSQLLRGGYANEVLRQFAKIKQWAARDPRVTIVRTPDEAEAVLKSKEWRLGVILAAEGAGGADTIPRLEKLWNAGLRMLTIAHFKSSSWGGAAAVRYWPWASCVPGGKDNGRRSPRGLSKAGEDLSDWAVKKGLIIDLTHASDKTVADLARRHPALPLLFSHEAARALTPCERTISLEQLGEVKRSRGLVGLTLAANYAGKTRTSLLLHAAALARGAGAESLALGSDFNGLIDPIDGVDGPEDYASILKEMSASGIGADQGAEAFVRFWRRSLAAR